MHEILKRDGLARIINWSDEGKCTHPSSITTPEILFVQSPRTPVPKEARAEIASDPSIDELPTIYHRGGLFSSRPAYSLSGSENELIKGTVMAQVPPTLWQPADLTVDRKEPDKGLLSRMVNENLDNTRVIYKSTSDDELRSIRSNKRIELVVYGNSLELFDHPRKFVEEIMRVKNNVGWAKLIYTPSLGEPIHLGLLAYMGIDFIDNIPLIYHARNKYFLTNSGRIELTGNMTHWYCSCRFCQNWLENPDGGIEFEHILGHNYLATLTELGLVQNAISLGRLRELVETRMAADPRAVNMVRFLDRLFYDYIETQVPTARKSRLLASTTDALNRPEVKRYQARIKERYTKPEYGRVLLLLPCSARKPYSMSQTHRAISSAISKTKNPNAVHEVIITSPLGIVPRELELVYPAAHYDIPVTGTWYEEEKKTILNLLTWLFDNFEYNRIIAHTDNELTELLHNFGDINFTGSENLLSSKSLNELSGVLNEAVSDCAPVSGKARISENVKAIAKYHFGNEAGIKLTGGTTIKGRYPNLKIFIGKTQLGMIESETGQISLTLAGGERLLQSGVYGVEIDDFILKGDVFAPAVTGADPGIRPGDEVVVFSGQRERTLLKAVGRAVLNGTEMIEAERGKAVKVRHSVK